MFFTLRMLLLLPLVAWRGYAIMKLWLWFLVPAFGVEPLRLVTAVGISLFVSFMTHSAGRPDPSKDEKEEFLWDCLSAIVLPAFALLLGLLYGWAFS